MRSVLNPLILVTATWLFASCGRDASNDHQQPSATIRFDDEHTASKADATSNDLPAVTKSQAPPESGASGSTTIEVKHPSGEAVVLNLISVDVGPAIETLEQNGFPCKSPASASMLQQQDGKRLPIMKVDCADGSYQLTMMNDEVYIKPWTGTILGM